MALELMGRDVWLRHTGNDGKSYVQAHRVWDPDRFIEAQKKAVRDVNAKQDGGKPGVAKVEPITEEQYLAQRKSK
jgi:hypothetical protein